MLLGTEKYGKFPINAKKSIGTKGTINVGDAIV